MAGKCVRLVQGDPARSKVYYENPVQAALDFADQGAKIIHVVDLDGALGNGDNTKIVQEIIREAPAAIQVGGGIRDFAKAEDLLSWGAFRVVFGTACVVSPDLIGKVAEKFGPHRIGVALDVSDGKVVVRGWKQKVEASYLDFAKHVSFLRVGAIISTFTSVDGTLKGPRISEVKELMNLVRLPLIVSGGISSLDDIAELARIPVHGAIVGTALYEGKFSLREALEVAGAAD